jgi:hypothetical protein
VILDRVLEELAAPGEATASIASLLLLLVEARRSDPARYATEVLPQLAASLDPRLRALPWGAPFGGEGRVWMEVDDRPRERPAALADLLEVGADAPLHGLRIENWIVDEGQDGQVSASALELAAGIESAASLMTQLVHFELFHPEKFRYWDDDSGRERVLDRRLAPADLRRIVRALPPGLRSFSLSNRLDMKTLVMLREAPFWPGLHSLSLRDNVLRSNVAKLFTLRTELRRLDLSGNPIGDRGVAGLLRCSHLERLEVLCVRRCGATPAGVEAARRASNLPWLRHVVVQ